MYIFYLAHAGHHHLEEVAARSHGQQSTILLLSGMAILIALSAVGYMLYAKKTASKQVSVKTKSGKE